MTLLRSKMHVFWHLNHEKNKYSGAETELTVLANKAAKPTSNTKGAPLQGIV